MQYWVRLHFMDNPSNIHSPQLGKSLWLLTLGQTPAGFAQIQLFGLKEPEKIILWDMAAQIQMRSTGQSCHRSSKAPGVGSAQGQGLSAAAAEKGGKRHWGIPQRKGTCWDGLLPARTFGSLQTLYFTLLWIIDSQARGEGKAVTFPALMENITEQPHQHRLHEIPSSPLPCGSTRKIHPAAPKQ